MDTSQPWLRHAFGVAALYVLIGLSTVALGRSLSPGPVLFAVRLSSWLVSAVMFFIHIAHEGRRLPAVATAAWHTSAAVAMATETLALVATVRLALMGTMRTAMIVALVAWPVLTGVVSFLASLVLLLLLKRVRAEPDAHGQ